MPRLAGDKSKDEIEDAYKIVRHRIKACPTYELYLTKMDTIPKSLTYEFNECYVRFDVKNPDMTYCKSLLSELKNSLFICFKNIAEILNSSLEFYLYRLNTLAKTCLKRLH